MKYIDLTQLLRDKMPVYPGDQGMELIETKNFIQDGYTMYQLDINLHTGTHIDGPKHLTGSNLLISDLPIEQFIGDAIVLDVEGEQSIAYRQEYEELIQSETIVVLHTGWSMDQVNYFSDHPSVSMEFTELLIRKNIKMLALDMPSPDHMPYDVHKLLFKHKILIAENLTNVEQLLHYSKVEIIALPILIQADSAIARIIARVE